MAAMDKWRHLKQSDAHLPPLLVKGSFSKNGYSICLTDLSRIWVEKLDKSEIIARARRRNCSIDPSEDTEQYGIFLDKIQTVLQQHSSTNLAISSTNGDNLKLHLEAPLPSPLPVFEWEISLELDHHRRIEDELVSPLLQQAHNLNHHMQVLIAEIQAKDKIIAKITDRLESSGHGLTAVFPGLANVKLDPRKPQQEQYARHVRGLGEFDIDAWTARIAASNDTSPITKETADAVFSSTPTTNKASDLARSRKENWWQSIPSGRHIALNEDGDRAIQSREAKQLPEPNVDSELDVAQDDEGFQRQATPPHLRKHAPTVTTNGDVDMDEPVDDPPQEEDSTEDEDDLDAPPKRSKPSQHQTHSTRTQTKTQRKAKTPSPSPSPPPPQESASPRSTAPPPTQRGPFTHDDDTEDDDDDLDKPSQPSQQASSTSQLPSRQKSQTPQPSTSTAPSPRKRLGTLGGRARTKSPTPKSPIEEPQNDKEASPPKQAARPKSKLGTIGGSKSKPTQSVSPNPGPESASTPQPTKKLGTIGGKRAAKSSRDATPSSVTPEPERRKEPTTIERKREVKADPTPAEPEDPVEKANAKRDELKRQLEEKAKAPVKKKRKF